MSTFLDERWFELVRTIGSQVDENQWLHRHAHISEEERDLFLSNDIENPQFLYKKNKQAKNSNEDIKELLAKIQKQEKDAVVLELYERKLEKLLHRSALLQAMREITGAFISRVLSSMVSLRKDIFHMSPSKSQRCVKRT